MKTTSLLLALSLLSAPYAFAQSGADGMRVETQSLSPTSELEQEMTLAGELPDKKQDTLIPQQPAVEVTADPLDFFESDQVKNKRQGAEWATEQQILDELERERMGDEKRRANSFLNRSSSEQPMLYEDPNAMGWYIMGSFGSMEYNSQDVSHDQSLGFAVGTKIFRSFIFEGSFTMSQLFIDDGIHVPVYKVNQMNVAMAIKSPLFAGQIFNGRVQPEAGVLASYTRRAFKQQSVDGRIDEYYKDTTTNALDVGITMGVDFNATRNFALGMGYVYYFNLSDGGDSEFETSRYNTAAERRGPMEAANYHQLSLNAKFKF